MFKNKSNKKFNIIFVRRFDNALFASIIFLLAYIVMMNYLATTEVIKLFMMGILFFAWNYFTSTICIKKIKVESLEVHNSLNQISAVLLENALILQDKIGDFYIFKTRNLIIPNISISVKECSTTDCLILLRTCDVAWLEDSLKDSKL